MTRSRLIETFNTHRMSAAAVQSVATARELELGEVMHAVRRAASQPQQTAQHLIIYGERGSGKSFLMRLVEIEVERLAREEGLPVMPALLPEEQYNIRSAPQLIQAIAAKVRGAGWEATVFAMDSRPLAEAWEAAVTELDAVLDQRFGQGLGLVVVMLENFDTLTRSLFGGSAVTQKKNASTKALEQSAAEQLLRKLMNTKGSRLMLIASATGTVDQDYERPLFLAFKTLDLRIWTSDDCIVYFNRRRALENQPELSPKEEARARAIAEFIGGNPRLAQLLGEVLASPDARSIAATLDALSDYLSEYYRQRLSDLPPQSAALLDALIRKGEPCTQTELAARVGASGQAQIADAFRYLLSSRLLAADPDKLGMGKLYRLRDRLFVHFYRRRYGEPEQALGLAPIAELLESFFTQREREGQIRRHLEAGEWADARLYELHSPSMRELSDGYCWYREKEVTGTPEGLFKLAGLDTAEAAKAQAELKLHPEQAIKSWKDEANRTSSGLRKTAALLLKANALSRFNLDNEAEEALTDALRIAEKDGDKDAQTLALVEIMGFAFFRRKDLGRALDLSDQAGTLAKQVHNDYIRTLALLVSAWNLSTLKTGCYREAIAVSDEAIALSLSLSSQRLQARALRRKAYALDQLKCYDKAASVAKQAVDLAIAMAEVRSQIEALDIYADALSKLGKHEDAESIYGKSAQLAASIGDKWGQSRLLWLQSQSLRQLNRPEQALATAHEAADLAARLCDIGIQAKAKLCAGRALNDLEKFTEAAAAFEEAAQLAARADDVDIQLESLGLKLENLLMLNQYNEVIELAQIVYELAITNGDIGAQTDALRIKGRSLIKLGCADEAMSAFDAAFRIAKSADQKQKLISILKDQANSLGQKKPEQTLALAREVIAETRNTVFAEELWTLRRIFFVAATQTRAPDVAEAFGAYLAEVTTDESAQPLANILDTVIAAVAYNNIWDEFTSCLSRHPQALFFLKSPRAFDEVGRVWSEQVHANGRAQTYAVIARQLPTIVQLAELLPLAGAEAEAYGHLRGLINGLVNYCDDAGFLQDMAELLKEGFGGQAEAEVQRLCAFAEVHAAPDKEKVLQRLDPDLTLAIRRIWNIQEPVDLLAQQGRRKGR